jgi:hypothetical protein
MIRKSARHYFVFLFFAAVAASAQKKPDLSTVCQAAVSPPSGAGKALKACVDAIRTAQSKGTPQEKADANGWIAKLQAAVDPAIASASAALAAYQMEDARGWCDAAIFIDPSKRAKCDPVSVEWKKYQLELFKLQQARSTLEKEGFAHAEPLLSPLRSDPYPAIASEAIALSNAGLAAMSPDVRLGTAYVKLGMPEKAQQKCENALIASATDPNAFQCLHDANQAVSRAKQALDDQKNWSVIEAAKALNADGQHAAAVNNLTTLLGQTGLSPAVAGSAREAIADARTNSWSVFRDALKSPWIMQFLGALAIVAGVWIGLHLLRWLWRKIYGLLWARVRTIQWAFTGVQDDGKLGASDAVLDAMRRTPNEVKQAIWTPGGLILHDTGHGFEVWEDFGVTVLPPEFKEKLSDLLVKQGRAADNALVDAFQNLQFSVGTVSLPVVAKFWKAILDWWRDGQPAFSGVAQEAPTADNLGKQVVVRLTCVGGPYGTVSVLASTRKDDSVDALALTASRAAYKLLSQMSSERESVEQIDGHAAFRQGARILACYVRSAGDPQADQVRAADLAKALQNLEFARQVFCRDATHQHYHLQALRFEGIAQALLGHTTGAITRFEELEDRASEPTNADFGWMAIEAAFNQGVLHLSLARTGANVAQEIQLATELFLFVESKAAEHPAWAKAALVCRASVLSAIGREAWPQMDRTSCDAALTGLESDIGQLETNASTATGDDRRAYCALVTEGRRNLAIGRLRSIAAFDIIGLGPFDAPPSELQPNVAAVMRQCLTWFARSDAFGSATPDALVCRAYALLLSTDKWRAAEYYARQALAIDKTSQFACYIAAEACRRRQDDVSAKAYIATLVSAIAPNAITDPLLCRLNRAVNPPTDTAIAAASCG